MDWEKKQDFEVFKDGYCMIFVDNYVYRGDVKSSSVQESKLIIEFGQCEIGKIRKRERTPRKWEKSSKLVFETSLHFSKFEITQADKLIILELIPDYSPIVYLFPA